MPGPAKIVPIILAAGPSTLGFPEALAKFGEQTALDIAVENCAGLQMPIVVLGSEAERVRPFVPKSVRVVVNENWRAGQMSSLRAALRHFPADADFSRAKREAKSGARYHHRTGPASGRAHVL